MAGEIFISYRRADQAKARLLHALLKQRGVDAWYDALLDAGADWRHKTAEALEKAPIFVLLFSKVASESDDISKELAAATFSKKLVIPVRIENIKPSGAFLYELASRNWVDAFEDTEAKFEDLADKLAALVKGGPDAEVAAFKLGAPVAPEIKPAARPLLKQPLVLGGIAMAAGALVAVAALFAVILMGSKPETAGGRLTAFFGFTPSGDDQTVRTMAEAATAETFKTFSVLGLETASEASTRGVALADQLDAAKALKARYALGGEVGPTADGYDISIRIDDVETGKTLWREAMSGGATQTTSLPVAAAAQATTTINCLVRVLEETGRPTEAALAILPRACASFQLGPTERIPTWRQAAKLLPNSAHAHEQLASALYSFAAVNPDAQRAALESEAREAATRAISLDPGSRAQDIVLRLTMGQVPLAEIDKRYVEALAKSSDMDPQAIGGLEYGYGLLMMMVGRIEDSVPHLRRAAMANPLSYPPLAFLGHSLMQNGQTLEGRSVFEQTNARLPSVYTWVFWVTNEVAAPGGDADRALKLAPSMVSGDTLACYRDYAAAAKLPDGAARRAAAARARTCMRQTGSGLIRIFGPLAFLGDVDSGFDRMREMIGSGDGIALPPLVGDLMNRDAAAARADPRFLPLVKKTGQYQYWLDTGTQPDACKRAEEREFEVCRELRREQAK